MLLVNPQLQRRAQKLTPRDLLATSTQFASLQLQQGVVGQLLQGSQRATHRPRMRALSPADLQALLHSRHATLKRRLPVPPHLRHGTL
jgi:hypothetical protein